MGNLMTETTKILNFVLKYSSYDKKNKKEIREVIKKHLEYGTCMLIKNEKEKIVAVARWNFISPYTVHILDVIIRSDYHRKKNMLKRMILLGRQKYPQVKWFCYERYAKYPERDMRYYSIDKFLGMREKEVINV